MTTKRQRQKRNTSDVESVHRSDISVGTEQIQKKASQNTKNVFSRMLSRSK